ncbi:hypothetical protein ACFCV8_10715 [Streptomyces sp. NPDC056347]|uniref:hypothetical protein n=1 Tax=Streptomyces sp. NPDC056347 TaxID=3345790 RepID=UPI0035E01BCE
MNLFDSRAPRTEVSAGPLRGTDGSLVIENLENVATDAVALFTVCIRSVPAGGAEAVAP